MAGDPDGAPSDSPGDRVDENTTLSEFGGVGSVLVRRGRGMGYMGTGTLIDSQWVLTAAHLLDTNGDGSIDYKPGILDRAGG